MFEFVLARTFGPVPSVQFVENYVKTEEAKERRLGTGEGEGALICPSSRLLLTLTPLVFPYTLRHSSTEVRRLK